MICSRPPTSWLPRNVSKKNRHLSKPFQSGVAMAQQQPAEVRLMTASFFQGPLPPPEQLVKYEAIMPGMTERLVRLHERTFEMAKDQSEHRRALERHVIESNTKSSNRGQWMAYSIMLVTFFAGCLLVYLGKRTEGLWSMFGPLAGILAIFLHARSKQDKELERRRRELELGATIPDAP